MSRRAEALAQAKLELRDLHLTLRIGPKRHPIDVVRLRARTGFTGSVYVSGETEWDEAELFQDARGALLLKRTRWRDVHVAGKYLDTEEWFRSVDGRRWGSTDAPRDRGTRLDQVQT